MRKSAALVALTLCGTPSLAQAQSYAYETDLAHVIFGEARGEPLEGQAAVGWTAIDCLLTGDTASFGGPTLHDVIFKHSWKNGRLVWQYDGAHVPVQYGQDWDTALWVAHQVLSGDGQPNLPILYFCSLKILGACKWERRYTIVVGALGNHEFALDKRYLEFSSLAPLPKMRLSAN